MESQQTQTDLKFLLNTISIISAGLLYTNHIHSINVYKIVVNWSKTLKRYPTNSGCKHLILFKHTTLFDKEFPICICFEI